MLLACSSRANAVDFDCTADPFGEPFMSGVIETLAQEEWEGRKFDSEGLGLAAEWIAVQFACLG